VPTFVWHKSTFYTLCNIVYAKKAKELAIFLRERVLSFFGSTKNYLCIQNRFVQVMKCTGYEIVILFFRYGIFYLITS